MRAMKLECFHILDSGFNCGHPPDQHSSHGHPFITLEGRLLREILAAAWKYDDKPHQLFRAVRSAAMAVEENREVRDEIFRLMDDAAESRNELSRNPLQIGPDLEPVGDPLGSWCEGRRCWIHGRNPALNISCEPFIIESEGQGCAGLYVEGRDTIYVHPNQSDASRHFTLLHEILHRIELRMVKDGLLPEQLDHELINSLSIYLLPNLVDAGLYLDPPEGIDEELERMAVQKGEGE